MSAALFAAALNGMCAAQEAESDADDPASAESETESTAPEPAPTAPYDDRLIRLSEIVGSVHYLRELCNAQSDRQWRELMRDLIEAEAPEPDRRARLTAAFNRGYRSFASVYTDCTPAATAAEARYRSEGATLASEIIARFGN
nr:TIGR02301 family protein [Pararhizobium haloflavum]